MPRFISLFSKETGFLVSEYEIENDLKFLRKIFDNTDNDPLMYDVYRITSKERKELEDRFNVEIDIDKYSCSVDYSE